MKKNNLSRALPLYTALLLAGAGPQVFPARTYGAETAQKTVRLGYFTGGRASSSVPPPISPALN